MKRGHVVFAVLFLLLPLLALLAIPFVPGTGFGLGLTALTLLAIGFFFGIGYLDMESPQ